MIPRISEDEKKYNLEFGKRLKVHRDKYGNRYFSDILCHDSLSSYILGKTGIKVYKLNEIRKKLNLTAEEFLDLIDPDIK